MRGYIYALKDHEGRIFYVGATMSPHSRLSTHRSNIKVMGVYTPPVYYFMRENKIDPEMEILECKNYRDRDNMLKAETKWIRRLKKKYYIVNVCSLGGGSRKEMDYVYIDLKTLARAKKIAATLGLTIEEYVTEAIRAANEKYSQK